MATYWIFLAAALTWSIGLYLLVTDRTRRFAERQVADQVTREVAKQLTDLTEHRASLN